MFNLGAEIMKSESKSPYKSSWTAQFSALMWRGFLSVIKEPLIVQVRIAQTIVSNALVDNAESEFYF